MAEICVIVPVYMVEAYLGRCVDSVLNQTFKDYILVLVDDGSPDRCPELCDEYARRDSRIHVIHQKNGGLSAARNAGIDWTLTHTDCRWITFLDSDDWLNSKALELLLEAVQQHAVAIAACGYEETEGGTPVVSAENCCSSRVRTAEEYYQNDWLNATIAWGKLYRRDCFDSIRYPEGKIHEDEFVTYRILMERERIAWIPAPLYAYFVNGEGITKSRWRPQRMDVFEAYEQQIAFFRQRGNQNLADACLHRYLRNAYGQLMELRKSGGNFPKEEKMLSGRAKALLRECHRRGCLSFDSDFCVLMMFYPVRTRLHLYYLAAKRRLKKIMPEGRKANDAE